MDSLPAEILLDIAARVPFEAHATASLSLVNHRFHTILGHFEHSLIKATVRQQYAWAPRQFPGLFASDDAAPLDRRQLSKVMDRVATLTSIKAKCQVIRERGGSHQCAWTTKRSIETYAAGMLILYRICDAPAQKQPALIESLPRTSLAILLFTLMMSILLLRAIGPRIMLHCPHHHPHASSPAEREQHIRDRADLELACEELLLHRGPEFLLGLMDDRAKDTEILQNEFAHMYDRQMPSEDGSPPPTTLIAVLRRTFAKAANCDIPNSIAYMWDVLEDECADLLDDAKSTDVLERLVNGEVLDPVKKWCMACHKKI